MCGLVAHEGAYRCLSDMMKLLSGIQIKLWKPTLEN